MNLGKKIMYSRKKAGMSQIDLADAMGVSRQSVSKWETGEAYPDITKLSQLAKVLNVSVDWLLSDTAPDDFPETEEQEQKLHAINAYPDWMNHLPKFILNSVKQFGWLYGVCIAISGLVFFALGIVARILFYRSIFGSGTAGTQSGSDKYWGPFGGTDPFFEINQEAWANASFFTGVIITIGVVTMVAGILMALYLRKWGKKGE